ncbi:MAG: response regulator transcription factor [Taibaiella sp.]|nr:response regulator transcription factor [Taibaiella sp.]
MKILIIEDEQELSAGMAASLEKEHYLVECVYDFPSAMDKIGIYEYDCILLDITLPGGNGLDILRELKQLQVADHVIIISARDSLDDKLQGLDWGADDYLVKPFHIAELTARIKAVIRRGRLQGKNEVVLENCILNIDDRTLRIDDQPVPLNNKEFEMLQYLMMNHQRLVTKSAIAEHIWGDDMDQSDNFEIVYYQIKNLRKKLADHQAQLEIKSVYGVGYKLTAL